MKPLRLQDFTSARVSLGRAGNSLPTAELLKLQLAHARARQAVHSALDTGLLARDLEALVGEPVLVRSAVPDRAAYLSRPDLGRRLAEPSRELLFAKRSQFGALFVLVDGLSALAVQRHAVPVLQSLLPLIEGWQLAPTVIAEQGRVALGDEIGECLGAALSVVLIGERPGLSSPDSLGIYLTWDPHRGLTDVHRNCISNIHGNGLSYEEAAHKLAFLMNESRRRQLSGISLKEDAPELSRLNTSE